MRPRETGRPAPGPAHASHDDSRERAFLYDNSRADRLHRHVMTFAEGRLVVLAPDPPAWVAQLFPALRQRVRARST